jgi:hypothetical protein
VSDASFQFRLCGTRAFFTQAALVVRVL